mgnify:CR=1 FL=1
MSTEKIIQEKLSHSTLTKNKSNYSGRVDINHLIARARKEKNVENRTNLIFFSIFASLILIVGILLSF